MLDGDAIDGSGALVGRSGRHRVASASMRCPMCSTEDTRVIDSRPAEEGPAIRRRRECVVCGERFTTFERSVAGATVEEAAEAVARHTIWWPG